MFNLSPKNMVQAVYAMYAFSFIFPPALMAGAIVLYLKRHVLSEDWLASHVKWQIQTFWWVLAGFVVGLVGTLLFIGWLIMLIVSAWFIYRIIRGWLALSEDAPVVVEPAWSA